MTQCDIKHNPGQKVELLDCEQCDCRGDKGCRRAHELRNTGDLPEWTSTNGGVTVDRIAEARKEYADLGVDFNARGDAVVPGNNRQKFLKRRGLGEKVGAMKKRPATAKWCRLQHGWVQG